MSSIQVQGIAKHFGKFQALRGVDLEVRDGELLTLLGPSGSGKTTLLRILAGLEIPDAGSLIFDSSDVTAASPEQRRIGLVFQHYALFPHMTVARNVAFGLRVGKKKRQWSAPQVNDRVRELIRLVQLDGLEARFPNQLSGGQQQRVGLARALAVEPKVLLLDEPFGALDAKVRKELRDWVRALQRQLGITTIFVTHDQEEALELSDRIAVMNAGGIEQTGTPAEIYQSPACPFVCEFIGNASKIVTRVQGGQVLLGNREILPAKQVPNGPVTIYLRPSETNYSRTELPGYFPVQLLESIDTGPSWKLRAREPATGSILHLEFGRSVWSGEIAAGSDIFIQATHPHVFAQ